MRAGGTKMAVHRNARRITSIAVACALLFALVPHVSSGAASATPSMPALTAPMVTAGHTHTVGLRSDGTVVAVGSNYSGQCDAGAWAEIVEVAAGGHTEQRIDRSTGQWVRVPLGHTVGLKSDGTVVAAGSNNGGQCDVSGWTDIVAVAAGVAHTVGLKSDGTVVAVGHNDYGELNVWAWTDIVAVAAGGWFTASLGAPFVSLGHTVGLKSDGTVVAVGFNPVDGRLNVSGWTNIVDVAAGGRHTVGLKSDGTVIAVGSDDYGQCDVSGWRDIVAVSAGWGHTVGLKSDGTVVAVGFDDYDQCGTSAWTDIVAVEAGGTHTVGLKSDGTVVAVGNNDDGQCDVDWYLGLVDPSGPDPADPIGPGDPSDPDDPGDRETLPPVISIAGASRYETAVLASEEGYPQGADTVVIATGRNWPDALGGSALAGALNAPILLVTANSVPDVVADEIARLEATRAVIVGGEVAVGPGVAAALQGAGLAVERVAGDNRYETADAVALRTIEELGEAYDGTAFVATGGAYADAVAAGPLAARQGWPLFLAHPTAGLRAHTTEAMADVADVLVLGGEAAVSADTHAALVTRFGAQNVTRLAGASRYETAVEIAKHAVANTDLAWDRVGIATGQAYPDALAGGVLQGKVGSVMLLTRTSSLPAETAGALTDNKGAITTVTYFGGELAVSQAVRDAVSIALGVGPPADDPPADDPPGLPDTETAEIVWSAEPGQLAVRYHTVGAFLTGATVYEYFQVTGGSGEVEFTAHSLADTFEVEAGRSYRLSLEVNITTLSQYTLEEYELTISSPSAETAARTILESPYATITSPNVGKQAIVVSVVGMGLEPYEFSTAETWPAGAWDIPEGATTRVTFDRNGRPSLKHWSTLLLKRWSYNDSNTVLWSTYEHDGEVLMTARGGPGGLVRSVVYYEHYNETTYYSNMRPAWAVREPQDAE